MGDSSLEMCNAGVHNKGVRWTVRWTVHNLVDSPLSTVDSPPWTVAKWTVHPQSVGKNSYNAREQC